MITAARTPAAFSSGAVLETQKLPAAATRSEAAQRVTDAYGIPKRRVYALAVNQSA